MRTYFLARLYIGYCFSKTLKRGSEQGVGHQTHTLSTGKISTMLLQNQAITYICQLRQTCMPWRVLALRKAWKVAKCGFIYSCFSCSCYYHSFLVKTWGSSIANAAFWLATLLAIYLTIRQRGQVVYERIVNEGEAWVDYSLRDNEAELSNCFSIHPILRYIEKFVKKSTRFLTMTYRKANTKTNATSDL